MIWLAMVCLGMMVIATTVISAQTAPAAPTVPAQTAEAPAPPATAPTNDRIFGVLPNYLTVENIAQAKPLTAKQKFGLAADGTFDKVELGFVGVLAGLNQLSDENPSWGKSWSGFGKRYGEQFANLSIENAFVAAALPSVLHQDPRYFSLVHGNYLHRAAYAASRIVVTRRDSGGNTFNTSEVAGSFAAAGISNVYEPRYARTVGNTFEVWGTQVLIDTWSNELREFWPDIKHKVFREK